MEKEKRCSACGQALRLISNRKQLSGQGNLLIGAFFLDNPLSTAVEAGVLACPQCGNRPDQAGPIGDL